MTYLLTPVGAARYPSLITPDTKFNPLGEYKVTLELDAKDPETQKLIEQIAQLAKSSDAHITRRAALPFSVEGDTVLLKLKLKARVNARSGKSFTQQPRIFGPGNEPWDLSKDIKHGSKVRCVIQAEAYNTPAIGVGVTLRLKDVQVVELSKGFGGASLFEPIKPVFGDIARPQASEQSDEQRFTQEVQQQEQPVLSAADYDF